MWSALIPWRRGGRCPAGRRHSERRDGRLTAGTRSARRSRHVSERKGKETMMRRLFGTDGIRGVANVEPMTSETALKLGRAAGHVFKTRPGRHRIVIGKDTRLSGYMIESALTSGICSMGVDVLLVGPMPTPAIASALKLLAKNAIAGVGMGPTSKTSTPIEQMPDVSADSIM